MVRVNGKCANMVGATGELGKRFTSASTQMEKYEQ